MTKKQRQPVKKTATPGKVVTQPGDLWLLGQHRLLCGDSTDSHQVKQLMREEKADMAFIDPPYNVNYRGCRTIREEIKNDNLTKAQFTEFLHHLIHVHQTAVKRGGSLYICHGSRYQQVFQHVLEANDFEIRNQIIWAKHHFVLSFARYKSKHELLFYCHRKQEKDPWYGDRKQTTVWEIPKPAANKLHPTMKPVALVEKALINSSKTDDIVVDLCGGAGSTLMACEKLERAARLMEIEPHYIDASIQRWQAHTKQQALLAANQVTYDELAAQQAAG